MKKLKERTKEILISIWLSLTLKNLFKFVVGCFVFMGGLLSLIWAISKSPELKKFADSLQSSAQSPLKNDHKTKINSARIIDVGGSHNNCGANVMLHAIIDHWDLLQFTKGKLYSGVHHDLLKTFCEFYPKLACTPEAIKDFIDKHPNEAAKEIAFGKVIRKHIANTIQRSPVARQEWVETNDPAQKGLTFDAHCHRLGNEAYSEMFTASDLNIYAENMGIELEIDFRNNQFENSVIPPNVLFTFRIRNQNENHWQYEAPEGVDLSNRPRI